MGGPAQPAGGRHGKCQITKLEEDYTYEVVPEDILRHCPPLVDLSLFKRLPHAEMHPLDAELLDDDFGAPIGTKRSQQHNRVVPWMRKTEYISTEFNRFGQAQDRSENKIGYSIKKSMAGQQETLYRDAASQIEAIERIFDKVSTARARAFLRPTGPRRSTTRGREYARWRSCTSCRTKRSGSTRTRRWSSTGTRCRT